ncbi:MAG: helix-turn-helix domain-containing protein [bacterium]|nr:helix-turn-helix domain-containing protein [bacterium]
MDIGKNIKHFREIKKLSQKEVITAIDMGAAQYSRIENGKTEPSISTLDRISKALGVEITDLFSKDSLQDTGSFDRTIMEKVKLIESLSSEEKKTIYSILDAFVRKQKLKDTLENVLKDIR